MEKRATHGIDTPNLAKAHQAWVRFAGHGELHFIIECSKCATHFGSGHQCGHFVVCHFFKMSLSLANETVDSSDESRQKTKC